MKRVALIFFSVVLFLTAVSQDIKDTVQDGYKVFYHENGVIASEGTMRDGRPDGYWKTYNEEGVLIAEGNRKNFELDSTWKFYDEEGEIKMEINYRKGKKEGPRITYRQDGRIVEHFADGIKEGYERHYYPDGTLRKEIMFREGLEQGLAKEYGEDGRVITLITYKSGFIVDRQVINRYDGSGHKHGPWKFFYDNGIVRMEGTYRRGLEDGYFKEYDREGNLIGMMKYDNGRLVEGARELAKLEVRKDYYPDGKPRVVASYNEEGEPEGVRREYAPDGTIENSYIFKNGIMIGEGIVTEKGERDGFWKEYYDSGRLRAEGEYNKDTKTGPWKYYYENGTLSQEGTYNSEGNPEGEWRWYYENGALLREEYYYLGKLDGLMVDYDENGEVLAQGEFIEGLEEGDWFFEYGDARIEGSYSEGMRNGEWKYYWVPPGYGAEKVLRFQGRFIDDNPHGRHVYYWDNGKRKDEGEYVMGLKEGDWISYNYDGTPFLVVHYENGKETRYDGMKIQANVQE